MTSASGLASRSFSASRPKKRKYSCDEGTKPPFMRSRCRRSIITMSAPSSALAHVVVDLDAHALDAGRHQRRGPDDPHPRAERRRAG